MNIKIRTIPHQHQRYSTLGDWIFTGEDLVILVSKLSSEKSEFLIGLHEMIEAVLCKQLEITGEEVDKWDMNYDGKYDEPGDDPKCPYSIPHGIATSVERSMCYMLDMTWEQHEENCKSVKNPKQSRFSVTTNVSRIDSRASGEVRSIHNKSSDTNTPPKNS
jgi:hypothetical protein